MLIRPAGGLVEFRRSFSFILPVLSSAFYMEVVLKLLVHEGCVCGYLSSQIAGNTGWCHLAEAVNNVNITCLCIAEIVISVYAPEAHKCDDYNGGFNLSVA